MSPRTRPGMEPRAARSAGQAIGSTGAATVSEVSAYLSHRPGERSPREAARGAPFHQRHDRRRGAAEAPSGGGADRQRRRLRHPPGQDLEIQGVHAGRGRTRAPTASSSSTRRTRPCSAGALRLQALAGSGRLRVTRGTAGRPPLPLTSSRPCPSSRSIPHTGGCRSAPAPAGLAKGIEAGDRFDAARRHGLGQDGHHGLHHRAGPAAGARDRPQQDARRAALQRVPRVLSRQRGRVLRLLLRLLPARGLCPRAGPLHREGLLNKRGDRPAAPRRHQRAVRRRDVVVVASVSCIFGLGSPDKYNAQVTLLKKGDMVDRDDILRKLVDNMYTRNDATLGRGTFRVRGETLEVFPAYAESAYRAVFFGDEIEEVQHFDPLTGEILQELEHAGIWPATHYATDKPTIERAIGEIRDGSRCARPSSRPRAAARVAPARASAPSSTWRCCASSASATGSRTIRASSTGAGPATAPTACSTSSRGLRLLHRRVAPDGAPDRRHVRGRLPAQETLVDYGFRLPSALDNRPQTFDEFLQHTLQMVFVSATPGDFELTIEPHRRADRSAHRRATPRSTCARRATRSTT